MKIKICDITGKPFQSRKDFNEKEIAVLAAGIMTNGLLHPIILRVNGSGYDLIAGERRLRAHIALGLDAIEAKLIDAADGKQTMKERRAKLEKRRVVRYLCKIVEIIEEMVAKRHEFPYSSTVPLVYIFGAESIAISKATGYLNVLDGKFNDDHAQAELFLCLAPKMINALIAEQRSENPQKKRGDIFKDWLGIACEKLYAEAVDEIPEPKSWANEKETKAIVGMNISEVERMKNAIK